MSDLVPGQVAVSELTLLLVDRCIDYSVDSDERETDGAIVCNFSLSKWLGEGDLRLLLDFVSRHESTRVSAPLNRASLSISIIWRRP